MPAFNYPFTRTVAQVDDYHGTAIADPYRWLEDTDSAETRAWIAAQNTLTHDYLSATHAREQFRQRLTELWDYARAYAPVQRGGRYFQLRNTGLQNHNVLYVTRADEGPRTNDEGAPPTTDPQRGRTGDGRPTTAGGAQNTGESRSDTDTGTEPKAPYGRTTYHEARVLLDPNTLSPDGTVSLEGWSVSEDGRFLAYALSGSGSDWRTWQVRDVDTGRDLPDMLEWSKFSGAEWAKDGSGFYYGRYEPPAPGQAYAAVTDRQRLYFHRLGDPQSADSLIYERPDQPKWAFHPHLTHDGRYLVLHVSQGSDRRNRLFYQDLMAGGPVVELIAELEASFSLVDSDGPVFYLHTDLAAPNGRVIAIDLRQPAREQWRTVIPEQADALRHVLLAGGQFVALYLHDAYHVLRRYALDGAPLGDIPLPTLGSVNVDNEPTLSGRRDSDELFYVFHSFVHPYSVYRHDLRTSVAEALFTAPVKFDCAPYVTHQVFVTSRDGTRVPMFLVHRRDLASNAPTLLFGYGGFNNAQTPAFQPGRLAWLELGGVYALAGLRGGGEYGEAWHQAGSLLQKQNTFDDFIASAEYLIGEGITSRERLAIEGRSNGGLLVGACLTQRPDLFGAVVPHVGVMDMLRFHKFTIGWAWVSDYGSADDPAQFEVLRGYSPLHNLRPGTRYPATLITTADHDDRVVPGHSFKFAAALQAAQAGEAPILIRVQAAAGHGGARKPVNFAIAEQTDMYTFLLMALGVAY